MASSSEKYVIVYSLNPVEGLDIVLPTAYICNLDQKEQPAYITAAALLSNAESYIPGFLQSMDCKLVESCLELSVEHLEIAINKGKKKPEKLQSLFADPKIQKSVRNLIDRKLLKWLEQINKNKSYICFNLQRKIKASDLLLHFINGYAVPKLWFTHTQTGVKYDLTLQIADEVLIPNQHDLRIISDIPASIILDSKFIISLENINAAKLKPFQKNESVFIPKKILKTYFEQFVTDVMAKADVEAVGFEIHREVEVTHTVVFCVHDFIQNKWLLDIKFYYGAFLFKISDAHQRKTKIDFDIHGDIFVKEARRNSSQEMHWVDTFKSWGLEASTNNRLCIGDSEFGIFEWISQRFEKLKDQVDIEMPEINGKKLTFEKLIVKADFQIINDWFDLMGFVIIGEESYPIAMLFRNIKDGNRFFRCKDGTLVLIPEEIMTKYHQLVKFAQESSQGWKLSKTHFTLLDESQVSASNALMDQDVELQYKPSNSLKASLRPYQEDGVKWLLRHRTHGLGACLADDMGLGKTLQTIAALLDAKENKVHTDELSDAPMQLDLFGEVHHTGRKSLGALIVLPASLVFNWYAELKKFAPSLQVIRYAGPQRKKLQSTLLSFDVVLMTYQTLVVDLDFFKALKFHYLILDESQQIRNKNSKTFQAVHQLQADHRLSLSGTPIENSLADLWAQMEFINPSILGSFSFFKEHFIIPIEKNKDPDAITELKQIVDPYILRRTKEQVAKDLPELVEMHHYAEMTDAQAKIYESEKSAARNYLAGLDKQAGQYRFHVLSSLMKLRQIANHPVLSHVDYKGESGKFDDVKDQIRTVVKAGHKVLVFSSFISHLALFESWMGQSQIPYLKLTGEMSSDLRQEAVQSFQHDDSFQVFLLSIKAGGTGLNLTAADYVFILDPWWNPFVEKQAVARAHRIGRTQNVVVKRFISKDTIEEKIIVLQQQKKDLSDQIIDIQDMPEWSVMDLEGLLS